MVPKRAALIFATVRVSGAVAARAVGNPVHVRNDYYGGVTAYGVASTVEADPLVEGDHSEGSAEHPFRQLRNGRPGVVR
ncbi:hypothetical protein [Lentzea sp. NPDC004782]|uniref:hypothetical protein n=1 Tax=Lentzea sp. NPDC004782 TaxID=3154458 RepID=UPI0033B8DFDF